MKLFVTAGPRSRKVMCSVCGATGHDVPVRRSWKEAHVRGHAPCPWCGKQLSLMINGKPRTHSRCPQRPGWRDG